MAFREAIGYARHLTDFGQALGFNMRIVDLGGGYPGAFHHTSFDNVGSRECLWQSKERSFSFCFRSPWLFAPQ